jgi:hypothetical protein
MKLEDIVCDLKYARQLRKLKVKQDSLYFYGKMIGVEHVYPSGYKIYDSEKASKFKNDYSAFTTDELLKLLPETIIFNGFDYHFTINIKKGLYTVYYCETMFVDIKTRFLCNVIIKDKKLSNALVRMLIYLVKENFIEVK